MVKGSGVLERQFYVDQGSNWYDYPPSKWDSDWGYSSLDDLHHLEANGVYIEPPWPSLSAAVRQQRIDQMYAAASIRKRWNGTGWESY
ncbi:hypothetical protein ATN84_01725 [Paramesorhizobium deserti]|uniref:Uncharacterized protein n=2 Tax=Paramesorhizobium deserti TaxID=1494590 RepID=A0A135HZC0_9HYPH|nr:hypothetical protein ATN84_01725 [Paramesorhizobium deserti]